MKQPKLTDISRKSKSALQRQSLLDRLKLKDLEQPKFVIAFAAGAFILHWLANVVASLMLLHFQPEPGELALLISLLLTSLFTFVVSIVSLIELLKFSYAGCSIAVILSWANFFLNALLLIYTHFWLGACIHLAFALSMTVLLTGRKSVIKYVISFVFLVINFGLILYPTTKYMEARVFVDEKVADIDKVMPSTDKDIAYLSEFAQNAKYLHTFAPYFGEKQKNISLYSAYYALAVAYNGSIEDGYKLARKSVQDQNVRQSYVNKIKIYAMLKNVEYEDYEPKTLSASEFEAIEKKVTLIEMSEGIGLPEDDDLSDLDDDLLDDDDGLSDLDS